jgi:hypothetical protein
MAPDAPHVIRLQQRHAGELVTLMLLMATHFVKENPGDQGRLMPLESLYRHLAFVTVKQTIEKLFEPIELHLADNELRCLVGVFELADRGRIPDWNRSYARPSVELRNEVERWKKMMPSEV